MVNSCSVFGCTERSTKGGVSFHSFPMNAELRQKWASATKRKNFVPSNSSKICGLHFLESDYMVQFGLRQLKSGTVPTIFSNAEPIVSVMIKNEIYTTSTRNVSISSSPIHSREEDEVCGLSNEQVKEEMNEIPSTSSIQIRNNASITTIPSKENDFLNKPIKKELQLATPTKRIWNPREPIFFGDYKYENLKTDEAKRLWQVAEAQIKKNEKKIKVLRTQLSRQKNKTKKLQDLIQNK